MTDTKLYQIVIWNELGHGYSWRLKSPDDYLSICKCPHNYLDETIALVAAEDFAKILNVEVEIEV